MSSVNREKIGGSMNLVDMIAVMSEGNPGAISVLTQISKKDVATRGFVDILHLDDMNIRGSQIWVAYKDFAKEDIDVLIKALKDRDSKMVDVVNEEGRMGNHDHLAVTSGASFERKTI